MLSPNKFKCLNLKQISTAMRDPVQHQSGQGKCLNFLISYLSLFMIINNHRALHPVFPTDKTNRVPFSPNHSMILWQNISLLILELCNVCAAWSSLTHLPCLTRLCPDEADRQDIKHRVQAHARHLPPHPLYSETRPGAWIAIAKESLGNSRLEMHELLLL